MTSLADVSTERPLHDGNFAVNRQQLWVKVKVTSFHPMCSCTRSFSRLDVIVALPERRTCCKAAWQRLSSLTCAEVDNLLDQSPVFVTIMKYPVETERKKRSTTGSEVGNECDGLREAKHFCFAGSVEHATTRSSQRHGGCRNVEQSWIIEWSHYHSCSVR